MSATKVRKASSKYGTLRGLVGSIKERAYGVDQSVRTFRAVRGLRDVHGKARETLSPLSYSAYFDYINSFAAEMLRQVPLKGYSNVAALVEMPELSLADEVLWNIARIKAAAGEISKTIQMNQELGDIVWAGARGALEKAQEISDEFGESIFLIERRIFLHQQAGGLEAQKRYVATVKRALQRGVAPFLSHHFSVRNEPSTSVARFTADVKKRCEKIKDRELAVYLEYKLTKQWPSGEAEIASVLRVEQNNASIDVYETFVCLLSAVRSGRLQVGIDVDAIADELSCIEDRRLSTSASSSGQSGKAMDSLVTGQYRHAMKECLGRQCLSIEDIITASICRAQAAQGYGCEREARSLRNQVVSRFAEALLATERSVAAKADLRKLHLNWYDGYLVSASTRLAATDIFDSVAVQVAARSVPDCVQSTRLLSQLSEHGDLVRLINDISVSPRPSDRVALSSGARAIALGAQHSVAHDLPKALVELRPLVHSDVGFMSHFATLMALEAAAKNRSVSAFLEVLSDGVVRQGAVALSPNVLAFSAQLRWKDIRSCSSDIRLSIAAHYLNKRNAGKYWGTCLRFAIDDFLKIHSIERPSQIDVAVHGINAVRYFWREVCEEHVVDMIYSIDGVKTLRKEMREILSALREIDVEHKEFYDSEIVSITHLLMIEDGRRIVDQSRIYVDEAALRQLLREELAEPFSRYRALAPVSVEDTREFDEVLRRVAKGDSGAGDLAFPKSEADQLLVEMINLSCNRFLFDAKHGLDSYLSKRIRHGSIVGHLRGAIEQHEMIFQALGSGLPYVEPDDWRDRYVRVPCVEQLEVVRAMCDFSEKIDAELLYAKNNVVQIRTAEKVSGLLGINLGAGEYHTIRSFVRRDLSFDGFLDSMFAAFWGLLNPSLSAVRRHLRERTAESISREFSRVRATVVAKRQKYPELSLLLSKLDQACRDVLGEVESVAQWFEKSGLDAAHMKCKLADAFAIGIESSKATYKNSNLNLSESTVPDFDITVADIPVLADVLLVIFGNIHTKSEVQGGAIASLHCSVNDAEGTLRIVVKNEVAVGVRERNQLRVSAILNEVKAGRIEQGLRREGESGFKKLAAIASQSAKGYLDFGFSSATEFFVDMKLSLILQEGGCCEG